MEKPLWEAILIYSLFGVYLAALLIVFCYSLAQARMLIFYRRNQKKAPPLPPSLPPEELPQVTVQLPIYNERYVLARLLKAVTALDYPPDKLQIQLLDDSTEKDHLYAKQLVSEWRKKGHLIDYRHRKERSGFKAGALKEGLKIAKGDFIAIFDADFLPPKDWLLQVIPHFNTPHIGAVQTRWGHLNREYSIFTWAQSLALDIHFRLEQTGRSLQDHLINFNGTAGIWRKSCIEDAGNWEGDTLTEDLDLSYRAQLKKWKIEYVEAIVCPAELPVMLSGIRSQQFRWNKGGAENFQKHIKNVWKSSSLSLTQKTFASIHLLNSSIFLFAFLLLFLSVPLFIVQSLDPLFKGSGLLLFSFSSSTLIFMRCYWEVHQQDFDRSWQSFWGFLKRFFLFYVLAMGFSFHNSWAVLQGHWGQKSAFIRTPKFDIRSSQDHWQGKKYSRPKGQLFAWFEMGLTLYFIGGILAFAQWGGLQDIGFLLLFLIAALGFGTLAFMSLKE
ncbi:MAG: glycosyltransferase [Flavobacteriaceae bacterium]